MYDHRPILERLLRREDLNEEEAEKLFSAMMAGEVPPIPFAGLLVALRAKGEAVPEIIGAVRAMRARAEKVQAPEKAVDLCGTGGDQKGTLNVSTGASFVVASLGIPVAKHGNRGLSSRCGSADLLEALGIPFDLDPETAHMWLKSKNFAFLFAPRYHPAMRHAAEPRKALGIRTIFNILGPLTNPAGVRYQLLGVFSRDLLRPLAETLLALGTRRAYLVHGAEGLDEVSPEGVTFVVEVSEGGIREYTLTPEDFGSKRVPLSELKGGTPEENAKRLLNALEGRDEPFARWIAMNAGLALSAVNGNPPRESFSLALEAIQQGRTYEFLQSLRA